ncbi:unnamed protein product [Ambrosiozyma monospora]|uniref:Unnamed protein product n=1 Tax=Ambrosiozyma monospora TaxID=43982 RepID=A0A9W7DMM6_AMBMO|nr:unnamed protein product [Ambrosiozyma monospora]
MLLLKPAVETPVVAPQESKAVEPTTAVPEKPKKVVETLSATPEEPKKVTEAPVATDETKPKVVEEAKAVEKTEAEEKKTEAPATSSVPASAPAAVVADHKPKESAEVTLSHLIATVTAATPVKDVFTFPYPAGSKAPDAKLQKSKRLKYDPQFLLQFQPKCIYKIDEEWGKKYASKIVIPDIPKRSDTRGGDRGGFGGRSNSQYNRDPRNSSGPGGMSRTSTLRNGEYAGRSGSRGGSRKKMGQGREKSQRQNSRRPRGDGRDRGERRERTHEGSRRGAPKEDEPPAPPPAPLVKSATRWVPASRKQEKKEIKYAPDGVTVIYDEEALSAKIKSLLNKLTLEKFDEITDELVALANQSKWETEGESLKTVIELTFAKACDEQFWSSMYAKFCLKLCKVIDTEIRVKSVEAQLQSQQDPSKISSSIVRRLLLTRCQFEYEKGWSDNLPTNEDGSPLEPEMMSDEYYVMAAAKRRGLGLVRFIGELFAVQLLGSNIIRNCIYKTLENAENPSEDVLETAIQLLNTTGPILDSRDSSLLDPPMNRLQTIVDKCKISSRLKFKLMDLLDLRRSGWKAKPAANATSGPKTITEIHAEAERKRQKEEQDTRRLKYEKRQNSSRSNSRWGNSNNERISSTDLSKVGVIRNSSSSNLGPFSNKRNLSSQDRKGN